MTRNAALAALALVAAACSRDSDARIMNVTSTAMAPTLMPGDRIECTKARPDMIPRGAVVVFEGPPGFSPRSGTTFVFRVVAVPGETISGTQDGVVVVDGRMLDEPYARRDPLPNAFEPVKVPRDEFFVLGDNCGGSSDSRLNGTVPRASIQGVCTRIASPEGRRGPIPGT